MVARSMRSFVSSDGTLDPSISAERNGREIPNWRAASLSDRLFWLTQEDKRFMASNVTVGDISSQPTLSLSVYSLKLPLRHFRGMVKRPRLFLREHRLVAGLTQEQLAERMEFSRGAIAMAETKDRNVTLEFLTRAATAIGVPVPALFYLPDELPEDVKALVDDYTAIGDIEAKQDVRRFARRLAETSHKSFDDEPPKERKRAS